MIRRSKPTKNDKQKNKLESNECVGVDKPVSTDAYRLRFYMCLGQFVD